MGAGIRDVRFALKSTTGLEQDLKDLILEILSCIRKEARLFNGFCLRQGEVLAHVRRIYILKNLNGHDDIAMMVLVCMSAQTCVVSTRVTNLKTTFPPVSASILGTGKGLIKSKRTYIFL